MVGGSKSRLPLNCRHEVVRHKGYAPSGFYSTEARPIGKVRHAPTSNWYQNILNLCKAQANRSGICRWIWCDGTCDLKYSPKSDTAANLANIPMNVPISPANLCTSSIHTCESVPRAGNLVLPHDDLTVTMIPDLLV
jgi:hypothetical protein